MNFPTDKKLHAEKKKKVDFAAILTGKEEVPEVDTFDTALATFQSNKKDDDKENLNFSVKTTDMSKIKEVRIDTGKQPEKAEVVAELYKSKSPTGNSYGKLM